MRSPSAWRCCARPHRPALPKAGLTAVVSRSAPPDADAPPRAAHVQRRRGPKPKYPREQLLALLEQIYVLNPHLEPLDVARFAIELRRDVGGGGSPENQALHLLRCARVWAAEMECVTVTLWLLLTAEGQQHYGPWRAGIARQLRKRVKAEERFGADRVRGWLRAHPDHDLIFSDYEESVSACLSRLGVMMSRRS